MGFSLSACVLDHALADVYTYQRHRWIGLSCFHNPAPNATGNIKYMTKGSWVSLLCQDTTHLCCNHLILDHQTGQFFLVLSILNKVRTGIIIDAWIKGRRHGLTLLLL